MGLIRRNWVWILAALVGIGVFAAFRLNQKTESEYFTAKVEQGDIRQVIEATGTINPVTLVQVGSQVSGMISKLYVDFNSKVTQGQVIAEIDPKLFQGAVLTSASGPAKRLGSAGGGQGEPRLRSCAMVKSVGA